MSLGSASIAQHCKVLRLAAVGAQFASLAEEASQQNHSHLHYLEALLQAEVEDRERRAIELRVKDAHLPRMKTLEEFDFAQSPHIPASRRGDNPTGDERFLSLSRQPKCIPLVATQSISSLKEALPNEGVKTLLQAFRTKIFLTTSDPDTARYASELCGKTDRTHISYTVSESSNNANVGWLSGRTSSSRGSVSASKQYQKRREPLFEENVFYDLKNAQSVIVAFDGISPLPPTYCYLKPDFLPVTMTWFDQERIGFEPKRIHR